ncbi:hypothetical protein MMPV_005186 [Pyropia vietnamensis]
MPLLLAAPAGDGSLPVALAPSSPRTTTPCWPWSRRGQRRPPPPPIRTLLIDNYDSYTYNLYQLLTAVNGTPPTVVAADAYPSVAAAVAAAAGGIPFDNVVVSPGPGSPTRGNNDYPPLPADAMAATGPRSVAGLPALGVCLGHQGLCASAGAVITAAPDGPVHGRVATVVRTPAGRACPLLGRLPVDAWRAVRYHSLAVVGGGEEAGEEGALPAGLVATAWADGVVVGGMGGENADGRQPPSPPRVLMAVRHATRPLYGVQFHPESVATEYGYELLAAFRDLTRDAATAAATATVTEVRGGAEGWRAKANGGGPATHAPTAVVARPLSRSAGGSVGGVDGRVAAGGGHARAECDGGRTSQANPPSATGGVASGEGLPSAAVVVAVDPAAAAATDINGDAIPPAPAGAGVASAAVGAAPATALLDTLAAAPPQGGRASPYTITAVRIDAATGVDTEAAFVALYGDSPSECFWLDSSSRATRVCGGRGGRRAGNSSSGGSSDGRSDGRSDGGDCSGDGVPSAVLSGGEEATAGGGSGVPPTTPRGRFSFMGDVSGPLGHVLRYDVVAQTLTEVRHAPAASGGTPQSAAAAPISPATNGCAAAPSTTTTITTTTTTSTTIPCSSFFDALDARLIAAGASLGLSPPPAAGAVPFDFLGGYVVQLGYELKGESPGVRAANRHASRVRVAEGGPGDAVALFVDRLVGVDHADGSVYLVAVTPADAATADEDGGATASGNDEVHGSGDSRGGGGDGGVAALDLPTRSWFHSTAATLARVAATPRSPPTPPAAPLSHGPPSPLRFTLEQPRSAYEASVRACLAHIAAGDSYELCLTTRLSAAVPATTTGLALHRSLRAANPAPYAAYLRLSPRVALACSSPERFLRISPGGVVESKPIKGTRPRGATPAADAALAAGLAACVKDRAENLMIADLVRADLGRVCVPGSVTVPSLMAVESYATVHQLVTTVRGQVDVSHRRRSSHARGRGSGHRSAANAPLTAASVMRAAWPMGSMTGAPKVRTLALLDDLEVSPRGAYSGSVGYLSLSGAADVNVVIRAAVLDMDAGTVTIGVGGAIVALSRVDEEFEEALLKGAAVMRGVAQAVTGVPAYKLDVGPG